MPTVAVRRRKQKPQKHQLSLIGPGDNGAIMSPQEFDTGDFEEGWRYELINGVLVVSPIPSEQEVDPNEELGHRLRTYRQTHPHGKALDKTLPERTVYGRMNRRRADRVIWAGLGRMPKPKETPTIIAEFVSKRKRDRFRDYETKRDEFIELGVQEYWVIDRFQRTLTVFTLVDGKIRKRVLQSNQSYRTELLPGFVLRLADLFTVVDDWAQLPDDDDVV